MLRNYIQGKVYVFIDAENLFYAQRTLGWKISYEKLMKHLKRECGEGMMCFIYSAGMNPTRDKTSFSTCSILMAISFGQRW
jgi:hypothetical protein